MRKLVKCEEYKQQTNKEVRDYKVTRKKKDQTTGKCCKTRVAFGAVVSNLRLKEILPSRHIVMRVGLIYMYIYSRPYIIGHLMLTWSNT